LPGFLAKIANSQQWQLQQQQQQQL